MSIIGGVFPSEHKKQITGNSLLLANARCALFIAAKDKTVWLPSYYCPSMLQSFKDVKFYEVDQELQIKKDTLKPKSSELVVFIDYFGWSSPKEIVSKYNSILDLSQNYFGNGEANFLVYSPRKFLPLPDGGILKSEKIIKCELEENTWWTKQYAAMVYRANNENDNNTWYNLFCESKKNAPVGYYSMSQYSKSLLHSFDNEEIKKRHRRNFLCLLSELKNYALFKSLPDSVIPYGFPITCQVDLSCEKIFPAKHWECGHRLKTMTLPCDWRYNEKDMHRIIDTLFQKLKVL